MITAADEATLRRLVGSTTFTRGRVYARRGAVHNRRWDEAGTRVVGDVQGAAPAPYRTTAMITRSASARLTALAAHCTCPVGFNCKHAVALLLAEEAAPSAAPPPGGNPPGSGTAPRLRLVKPDAEVHATVGHDPARDGGRPASSAPDWEGPLQALLGDRDETGSADIGLQFELTVAGTTRGSPAPGRVGIRIRPVLPGRTGKWSRTGISWNSLDYHQLGRVRTGETAERLLLVKELRALSDARGSRPVYRYAEETVWLEAIGSRRLWDLLHEATDLGIPLVSTGQSARPVTLRPTTAVFTIDATRTGSGIRLQPRVDVDGEAVPLDTCLLIGSPAHGIAWWRGDAPGVVELSLAPLADPLDDTLRGFLGSTPVAVPGAGEERFVRDLLPVLRRRVAVRSSNGSVELPAEAPPSVVVSVTHLPGHSVAVTWGSGAQSGPRPWGGQRASRERALLEEAARVVSDLPELFESTPYGVRLAPTSRLDGMVAVRFVSELLPMLRATPGLEVEVFGLAPDYREAEEAPVVRLGGSGPSGGDWFDLTVAVTVGGEEVPFQDLFVALAEERSHLILPSGTYFSLDRDELRQLADLIAEARALQDSQGEGIRLNRFQAGIWEELRHLGVITAQAGAWEASVRALSEASERSAHAVPSTLLATLRPYQEAGFQWLAFLREHNLGGILADDMGLGKTLQALALICHTKQRGLTTAPYLVVAPTSVVDNWNAECRRFAPHLATAVITGTRARRGVPLEELAAGTDVVITSYALFRLEYEAYEAVAWSGLFLDEAQFAKNRSSQAYRRAKLLPVPFKVAMTGTPMENNLMELWSLLSIAAPGLFASPEPFEKEYRVPIERHGDEERLARLRRRIRPLMLRRTKEQVVDDLPDKQEQVLELELGSQQRKLYQTYLQRERQKVLGLIGELDKNRFAIFRSLTLLRQASLDVSLIDPAHVGTPSAKLDALTEMVRDIVDDGHRVLIFSQFTRFLGLARQRMAADGIRHCYLDGRTRKRGEVIEEFRNGGAPVFFISLKAGGFGLNLTEADYCILLDPWWNPATEAQAVDRIHRIGQTRKVMVYRLVAKDTIEDKVMALKARKAALFTNVVDGGGFESAALTETDIRSLLGDEPASVGRVSAG